MLLAVLALTLAQPVMAQPSLLQIFADAPAAAAQAPCNPDPLKSLGCVAQHSALAADRKAPARTPMICNHDPLKGAACHAHVAMDKAKKWAEARSGEKLASATN